MIRTGFFVYAWFAAASFALSLLYFGYFFVVRLRQPAASEGTWHALAVDVGLFGLFAIHHSLMARTGAKRWLTRFVPVALERATYVWIASVLFAAVCAFWQDLPGTVYIVTGSWRWASLAIQSAGLLLIAQAASALDPLELVGVRQAAVAFSAEDAVHRPGSLRIQGAYAWVRHPIYLGWALTVFGAPEMPVTRFAFAVISTAYLLIAIPWEERMMVETFGSDYRRYVAEVRWRLVPGLY